jgi:hypothetical protein
LPCQTNQISQWQSKNIVGVMHKSWSGFVVEVVPGLALAVTIAGAAIVAFAILSRWRRGRARSAIAYLAAYFSGLAITAFFALAASVLGRDSNAVLAAGLLAAFAGPFCGIGVALLRLPARRRLRRVAIR